MGTTNERVEIRNKWVIKILVKLEQNKLILVPFTYTWDDITYSNYNTLSDEILTSHGWKTFVGNPMPEYQDGVSYSSYYTEEENCIVEHWKETPVPIEPIRNNKLKEIGEDCQKTIYAGVDVLIGENNLHFSLTEKDQINISTAMKAIENGMPGFLYHSDGELCRLYSADEIMTIGNTATQFIIYHTTYCNHLNYYIKRTDSASELRQIYYGMDLPEDLKENMDNILSVIQINETK